MCWIAEKFVQFAPVQSNTTKLAVVSSNFNQSYNSSSLITQERIRTNFRDFFTYAIKGVKGDPIEAGVCTSNCEDSSNCCSNVVATEKKTNMITYDNVCMLKSVVNSWNNLTLEGVTYKIQCSSNQNSVSGANILRQSVGIVLSVSILFYSSLY